jgi:hypothetical protein
MTMIIPEWWLAEAKYPVVVDPVVGSSVVGAYSTYEYMSQDDYEWYLDNKEWDPSAYFERYICVASIQFDELTILNKYKTPAQMQGTYNTFVYVSEIRMPEKYYNPTYVVIPLLYSDYNNCPKYLLAYNCVPGNLVANLGSPNNFTPRWVQSALTINSAVVANTDVWFGHCAETGKLRFDYGAPIIETYDAFFDPDFFGDYSSLYEMALDCGLEDISYCSDLEDPLDGNPNILPGARRDMKVSMYLAIPASYTHTVTQWVMPTETRKLTGKYQRSAKQTALGKTVAHQFEGFCRSMVQTVKNTASLKGSPTLIRKAIEAVAALYATKAGAGFNRGIGDTAGNSSLIDKMGAFVRSLFGMAEGGDGAGSSVGRMRVVQDTEYTEDAAGSVEDYLRGLFDEAGSMAETDRREGFYRAQQDTALSEGIAARRLFIFIRLLTNSAIRDFVIGRFLKSNEELIIKSPVCREIIIDSKLH